VGLRVGLFVGLLVGSCVGRGVGPLVGRLDVGRSVVGGKVVGLQIVAGSVPYSLIQLAIAARSGFGPICRCLLLENNSKESCSDGSTKSLLSSAASSPL